MNTYIAIRPYIAQQIVEHLKKLPYNEVSLIINEIEVSMNYPVEVVEGEKKEEKKEKEEEEEQRKPIGFRFVEEVESGDDDGDGEEPDDEPTIICKPKEKQKRTK